MKTPLLVARLAAKKLVYNPSWEYETALQQRGFSRIAGVDEAGRGPWAGPVVAAAVVLPRDFSSPHFARLHDSKKLSPALRAILFEEITSQVAWGIGIVDAQTIDEINIRQASWRAMQRAVEDLERRSSTRIDYALIDGLPYGDGPFRYEAIVKGDARSWSIAAASVVAKETRDALMRDFDVQFPRYGFATHKGYGTSRHLAALREYGACEIHRKTFRPVREIVESRQIESRQVESRQVESRRCD